MTAKELLKSKKLNVTDFRLSVLNIILKAENAVALEQIETGLGNFDRITLYRTIKSFKEKGIIHEIVLPDSTKKLALCSDGCDGHDHQHEHIHFHCENCKEVYCIDIPKFPEIELSGFSVSQVEIQAKGRCSNCAS